MKKQRKGKATHLDVHQNTVDLSSRPLVQDIQAFLAVASEEHLAAFLQQLLAQDRPVDLVVLRSKRTDVSSPLLEISKRWTHLAAEHHGPLERLFLLPSRAKEHPWGRSTLGVRTRDTFDNGERSFSRVRTAVDGAGGDEAAEDGAFADGRGDFDAAGLQLAQVCDGRLGQGKSRTLSGMWNVLRAIHKPSPDPPQVVCVNGDALR